MSAWRPGWLPWAALVLGTADSLAADVATASPGTISQVIVDWPALALLIAVKLLSGMLTRPGLLPARIAPTISAAPSRHRKAAYPRTPSTACRSAATKHRTPTARLGKSHLNASLADNRDSWAPEHPTTTDTNASYGKAGRGATTAYLRRRGRTLVELPDRTLNRRDLVLHPLQCIGYHGRSAEARRGVKIRQAFAVVHDRCPCLAFPIANV